MNRAKIRKKIIGKLGATEKRRLKEMVRILTNIDQHQAEYGYIFYEGSGGHQTAARKKLERDIKLPRFREIIKKSHSIAEKLLIMDIIYDMQLQRRQLIEYVIIKFLQPVDNFKLIESLTFVLKHEKCVRRGVDDLYQGRKVDEKWVRDTYLLYMISDV